jgi:hypothetical protein
MLCTLNANKAVGPDIISNRMLVSVKEEISKIREKVFPSDWKIAHVIPLFKNGAKSGPILITEAHPHANDQSRINHLL